MLGAMDPKAIARQVEEHTGAVAGMCFWDNFLSCGRVSPVAKFLCQFLFVHRTIEGENQNSPTILVTKPQKPSLSSSMPEELWYAQRHILLLLRIAGGFIT